VLDICRFILSVDDSIFIGPENTKQEFLDFVPDPIHFFNVNTPMKIIIIALI